MIAHGGTEIFRFKGKKMLVHYHRPAGPEGKRFPAVLFLHGFPGSEKSVDVQRELMNRGVATVAPSFLGAWGSGGEYRFTTLTAQARAALAAAKKLAFVDPRRVAVYGFSMGGWAALNMAAKEPSLKAVVAVAPAGGREMVGPHLLDFITRLSRPLNAPKPRLLAADFAKAVTAGDPGRAAAAIKAPLLLVHGDEDPTIPCAVSKRVAACAGGPVTLVIERGAAHDFLDRREKLTKLTASFLAKALLGALLLAGAAPRARAEAFGDAAFASALTAGLAEARLSAAAQKPVRAAGAKTPAQVRAAVDARLDGKVPAAIVDAFFADPRLQVLQGVVDRFEAPASTRAPASYEEYRKLFINPEALAKGAAFVAAEAAPLAAAEARFGVDRFLLAAHAGVETRYGTYAGKTPVGSALWTIALKVDRRSDWAVRELAELLVFAAAERLDAHALLGSYAGAFGFVQFMPSSANASAVDADADGRRDLYAWPDALGSAANYLKKSGYRAGEPFTPGSAIGRAVWSYNHDANYVRCVLELRGLLAQRELVERRDFRKRTKSSRYSR